MKIRIGFVSNSSSSSFVCDVCGNTESGYDAAAYELGFVECEKNHTFCCLRSVNGDCLDSESSYEFDSILKFVLKHNLKPDFRSYFERMLRDETEDCSYWIKDRNKDIQRILATFDEPEWDKKLDELMADDEFGFDPIDVIHDVGAPQFLCPICMKDVVHAGDLRNWIEENHPEIIEEFKTTY